MELLLVRHALPIRREVVDGPADPEGTSGAEEGISPWSPDAYDEDPEGPTQSTESES